MAAGAKERLNQARRLGQAVRPAREAAQRELLLEAMAGAVAAKGYRGCAVDDVLELSGLSRSTYYKHFESKEDCFLAAFEATVERLLERMRQAVRMEKEPALQIEVGLRELIEMLMAEPNFARLMLIEIRTMGLVGQEGYQDALGRFAQLLAAVVEDCQATSAEHAGNAGMVVGAVASTLALEVEARGSGELEGLLPGLTFVALALYLGPTEAAIEACRRTRK
jgi:AcrR family transcriptional regulator